MNLLGFIGLHKFCAKFGFHRLVQKLHEFRKNVIHSNKDVKRVAASRGNHLKCKQRSWPLLEDWSYLQPIKPCDLLPKKKKKNNNIKKLFVTTQISK
jgi:hypothetical protein